MMNMFFGLGSEQFQEDGQTGQIQGGEESLESQVAQASEQAGQIQQGLDSVDTTLAATSNLEAEVANQEQSIQQGGATPQGANSMQQAMEHFTDMTGIRIRRTMPASEAFTDGNRVMPTRLGVENLKEGIKKGYDAVIAFLKRIGEWFSKWWGILTNGGKKLKERVAKLKARTPNTAFKDKIPNKGIADRVKIAGVVDAGKIATALAAVVTFVEKTNVSSAKVDGSSLLLSSTYMKAIKDDAGMEELKKDANGLFKELTIGFSELKNKDGIQYVSPEFPGNKAVYSITGKTPEKDGTGFEALTGAQVMSGPLNPAATDIKDAEIKGCDKNTALSILNELDTLANLITTGIKLGSEISKNQAAAERIVSDLGKSNKETEGYEGRATKIKKLITATGKLGKSLAKNTNQTALVSAMSVLHYLEASMGGESDDSRKVPAVI